jgi:malonyl-CoA O-methyltransferase
LAAGTYDEYAGFQELMAGRLMELVPSDLSFATAIDVGSATGRVASLLSLKFPSSKVFGTDISLAMLKRAKEKSVEAEIENLEFIVSDFEALPFKDGSVDLALSNLSYQWASTPADAFSELYRVIAPGGLLIMNTLAHGTLGELKESFAEAEVLCNQRDKRSFMDFIKPGALKSSIEGAGLHVELFDERSYSREYASVRALLRVLKNIGAVNPLSSGRSTTISVLKVAEDYYMKYFSTDSNDGVRATYKTVFITARKPE